VSPESQLISPSPVDALLTKLDDPRVVAALNNLLDHADLLALLVTAADQFVRRGDEITDSLADGIRELGGGNAGLGSALLNVDLPKLAGSVSTLSGAVAEAGPALTALLRSDLTDPQVIEVLSAAARAVRTGADKARTESVKVSGAFSLLRTLKDDDVARGLGFLIHVLREFGRDFSAGSPSHTV
jgi:hypothetical protein